MTSGVRWVLKHQHTYFFNKQAQSFRWISVKSLNMCSFYHSALQCVSLLLSEWNRHRLSIFALYGKCWRKTFLRRLLSYTASLSCVKVSVVLTHSVCFLSSSLSKYDSNMVSISIDSALAIVFELWMLHWASKHLNTLFMLLLTVVSGLWRQVFWLMSTKSFLLDMYPEMWRCECDWEYSKVTLKISISLMKELLWTSAEWTAQFRYNSEFPRKNIK